MVEMPVQIFRQGNDQLFFAWLKLQIFMAVQKRMRQSLKSCHQRQLISFSSVDFSNLCEDLHSLIPNCQ